MNLVQSTFSVEMRVFLNNNYPKYIFSDPFIVLKVHIFIRTTYSHKDFKRDHALSVFLVPQKIYDIERAQTLLDFNIEKVKSKVQRTDFIYIYSFIVKHTS